MDLIEMCLIGVALGGGKHLLYINSRRKIQLTRSVFIGYSWLTNQYGLTVDTITAFEIVLPNGSVRTVTEASDPKLFSGLKVSP